jgi:hypothetical protein
MNTTMKSILAACGLSAAGFASIASAANNSYFSGTGDYVQFGDYFLSGNNYVYLRVSAYENVARGKSAKVTSSGASAEGNFSDGTYFYYFNGDTTTIDFASEGKIPDKVTASGSIPGIWTMCDDFSVCIDYAEDNIQFNVEAEALADQAGSESGVRHYEFGPFKTTVHFDQTFAGASLSNSSITSEIYGSADFNLGYVGYSLSHTVEFSK